MPPHSLPPHTAMVNSSLGNLSSAMLTAATPLPAGFHPAKMVHPLTNDAILSAYLGMQNPMTAQFAASKSIPIFSHHIS